MWLSLKDIKLDSKQSKSLVCMHLYCEIVRELIGYTVITYVSINYRDGTVPYKFGISFM